jgi:TnpA family transposase
MSKKIALNLGGRRFDVDVDEEFAPFLKQNMAKDFNMEGNNDLKVLLQAYVRKNHELYIQDKQMQEMIKKLNV